MVVAIAKDFFELPPARVAVVLIDFQNDFCSPEVAAAGAPVTNTRNAAAAVRANRFAATAAQLGAVLHAVTSVAPVQGDADAAYKMKRVYVAILGALPVGRLSGLASRAR